MLGVDDAATTVRLIKARMERQGAPRVPVSQAQWEAARRRLGADRRQRSRASRYAWSTGGRNAGLVVGIICAAITALTFTSFGHPWRSSNLLGSAFYGLVSLAAFSMYYQNRRTYRMMERYPRQPGAEPWGNVSESTAPVAGWSNLTVL